MPLTSLDINGKATSETLERIHQEAANTLRAEASSDGTSTTVAVEFDRTWRNGWALTTYAKAWWRGEDVQAGAGVRVEKKF